MDIHLPAEKDVIPEDKYKELCTLDISSPKDTDDEYVFLYLSGTFDLLHKLLLIPNSTQPGCLTLQYLSNLINRLKAAYCAGSSQRSKARTQKLNAAASQPGNAAFMLEGITSFLCENMLGSHLVDDVYLVGNRSLPVILGYVWRLVVEHGAVQPAEVRHLEYRKDDQRPALAQKIWQLLFTLTMRCLNTNMMFMSYEDAPQQQQQAPALPTGTGAPPPSPYGFNQQNRNHQLGLGPFGQQHNNSFGLGTSFAIFSDATSPPPIARTTCAAFHNRSIDSIASAIHGFANQADNLRPPPAPQKQSKGGQAFEISFDAEGINSKSSKPLSDFFAKRFGKKREEAELAKQNMMVDAKENAPPPITTNRIGTRKAGVVTTTAATTASSSAAQNQFGSSSSSSLAQGVQQHHSTSVAVPSFATFNQQGVSQTQPASSFGVAPQGQQSFPFGQQQQSQPPSQGIFAQQPLQPSAQQVSPRFSFSSNQFQPQQQSQSQQQQQSSALPQQSVQLSGTAAQQQQQREPLRSIQPQQPQQQQQPFSFGNPSQQQDAAKSQQTQQPFAFDFGTSQQPKPAQARTPSPLFMMPASQPQQQQFFGNVQSQQSFSLPSFGSNVSSDAALVIQQQQQQILQLQQQLSKYQSEMGNLQQQAKSYGDSNVRLVRENNELRTMLEKSHTSEQNLVSRIEILETFLRNLWDHSKLERIRWLNDCISNFRRAYKEKFRQ